MKSHLPRLHQLEKIYEGVMESFCWMREEDKRRCQERAGWFFKELRKHMQNNYWVELRRVTGEHREILAERFREMRGENS